MISAEFPIDEDRDRARAERMKRDEMNWRGRGGWGRWCSSVSVPVSHSGLSLTVSGGYCSGWSRTHWPPVSPWRRRSGSTSVQERTDIGQTRVILSRRQSGGIFMTELVFMRLKTDLTKYLIWTRHTLFFIKTAIHDFCHSLLIELFL